MLARGHGKTNEEKRAAEAAALGAAQETRTRSVHRTACIFAAWKSKVAKGTEEARRKDALTRCFVRRAW